MAAIDLFCGIKVYTSSICCKEEFARWRRPHRQKRIAKKWRKRYGAVYACPGNGYNVKGMGIYGCPHFVEKLKKASEVQHGE